MELPPLECARCRSLNARHAVYCAFCGKTLRTGAKRFSRASYRELALSGACWTLFLGVCVTVGITIWNLCIPPPLVVEGRRLIEYTPGADRATLVCSRCRGYRVDPEGSYPCKECNGSGQITVAVPRRQIALLSHPYRLCARCAGTGFIPDLKAGDQFVGPYTIHRVLTCPECSGTGYSDR